MNMVLRIAIHEAIMGRVAKELAGVKELSPEMINFIMMIASEYFEDVLKLNE